MSKLPRLLGPFYIHLPDDQVKFTRRFVIADIEHYVVQTVPTRDGLRQDTNQVAERKDARPVQVVNVTGVATSPQAMLKEIGKMHCYAATTFAITLARAQTLTETATGRGPLSLACTLALSRLAREYLHGMLASADEAGTAIMAGIVESESSAVIGAEQRRRIDQLSELYLQHVRDMLHSKGNPDDKKGNKPVGIGTLSPIR